MLILGIETSCDETAAALYKNGRVLSNIIVSQVDTHKEYGGVVPELASRKHIEAVSIVIDQAINQADSNINELEGIAVTRGPGLIGAILVGMGAAKGISITRNIPLTGVNHLHGHLFSAQLENPEMGYPFVGLVVSGGHTTLFKVGGPFQIEKMGSTRDDAAGEAFDKVAKLLGLGYPGGAVVEERASRATKKDLTFPRALMNQGVFDFSFSGLKTAVLRYVQEKLEITPDHSSKGSFHPMKDTSGKQIAEEVINEICFAFQESVVDALSKKSILAVKAGKLGSLVVSGGVAANRELRKRLRMDCEREGIDVVFPSMDLCSDNAAMIAHRGAHLLEAGILDSLDMDAKSRW